MNSDLFDLLKFLLNTIQNMYNNIILGTTVETINICLYIPWHSTIVNKYKYIINGITLFYARPSD